MGGKGLKPADAEMLPPGATVRFFGSTRDMGQVGGRQGVTWLPKQGCQGVVKRGEGLEGVKGELAAGRC